jgi:hypothetical protein
VCRNDDMADQPGRHVLSAPPPSQLVFAIAVRLSPWLHQTPTIAVGLGSLAGMAFNFLMYARYVFRPQAQRQSGG